MPSKRVFLAVFACKFPLFRDFLLQFFWFFAIFTYEKRVFCNFFKQNQQKIWSKMRFSRMKIALFEKNSSIFSRKIVVFWGSEIRGQMAEKVSKKLEYCRFGAKFLKRGVWKAFFGRFLAFFWKFWSKIGFFGHFCSRKCHFSSWGEHESCSRSVFSLLWCAQFLHLSLWRPSTRRVPCSIFVPFSKKIGQHLCYC